MDEELLDFIDDLTEEELKDLNNDLDVELLASSEKPREEHRSRMYEKKEMVNTLEEIIKRNKINDLPAPKQTAENCKPTPRTWKNSTSYKPSAIDRKCKTSDLNNNNNNNSNIRNKNSSSSNVGKTSNEAASDRDEDELLLESLTEEELLEIAALTDAHSLLTQDQAHSSYEKVNVPERRTVVPISDEEADLDVGLLMETLKNDTQDLFHIRINNMKLEQTVLHAIFEALGSTTQIRHLSLAGIHLKDEDGLLLNKAIAENQTLETLNLESNELTNICIEPLCKIFQTHAAIREFKCSHQKHGLGSRGEEAMARALDKNNKLLKISYPFKVQSARSLADRCQIRNNEILRQKRSKGEDFYNYKEEMKKRDDHPQPWIKEKMEDKNEKMKSDLANQKVRMKSVGNEHQIRMEAKLRAKENAKPTMDNELVSKLQAARNSRGRSMR